MELICETFEKIIEKDSNFSGLKLKNELEKCWLKLGSVFKDEVEILNFKDGVLFLGSSNNVLLFHLKQLSKELLEGFNRELGKNIVTSIQTRMVKLPEKTTPISRSEQDQKKWEKFRDEFVLNDDILRKIDNMLSDIDDEKLKEKMRSFYKNTYILEKYEQTK